MINAKRKTASLAVAGILILFTVLLYSFIYPSWQQYFPKCIFHNLTGLYCPLCGTQRALNALVHGNIGEAIRDNILVLFAILLFSLFTLQLKVFHKKSRYTNILSSSTFFKAALIIVIVFGVLRNIPFYPFTILAPF